jgi:hypothetical protein
VAQTKRWRASRAIPGKRVGWRRQHRPILQPVGGIADTTGTRFLVVTYHRITMARVRLAGERADKIAMTPLRRIGKPIEWPTGYCSWLLTKPRSSPVRSW